MWSDNETERDFLNFVTFAATVAKIIERAKGQPVSIGVSGSWGVGKSTLIKLIRNQLHAQDKHARAAGDDSKYIFVEFNAWLYQGYDDARASLMEVIARALSEEAKKRKTSVEKTKDLLARINWLRVAKLGGASAAAMAFGLPPIGLLGEVFSAGKNLADGDVTSQDIDAADKAVEKAAAEGSTLLRPFKQSSPPKEIEAIRRGFEEALEEMGLTLVVLIDDLDRCLPATAISTLEAVRLFLFLKNTAFVIAADTKMIRHAVSEHFQGIDDQLITSYFDKLIQIPINVPRLGTQDIRAYLSLLYIDASTLSDEHKDALRERICQQLSETWKGGRVDRSFIRKLEKELSIEVPTELAVQLDMADRLAPLMSAETAIEANPRLIKRFMNAISIRMAIGAAQGVSLDESVLTKLLLLERCGSREAYNKIAESSAAHDSGYPVVLAEIEQALSKGETPKLIEEFSGDFFPRWAASAPPLAEVDLRPALFVSREHAPLLLSGEQLTSEAAEVLDALLTQPDMASGLQGRINDLTSEDLGLMLDKLLDVARKEQRWGVPDILNACLAVGRAEPSVGKRVGGFLASRPESQIEPSIVPRIKDEAWAEVAFSEWRKKNVAPPVKAAIENARS